MADGKGCDQSIVRCPVFGECGGCQYQDIPYAEELRVKQDFLHDLFEEHLSCWRIKIDPIVPSPKQYHYRCRLDMKLLNTKKFGCLMGFSPMGPYQVIEVEACPIAMEAISNFLPELKKLAMERLPAKYRNANLVVKTGDDGRVFWGGIGRRSLGMEEEDFFWTEINGLKVYYSLDTFFQANLSILPDLMKVIRDSLAGPEKGVFYDLYGGVGVFGLCVSDLMERVVLIEENIYAIKVARHNIAQRPNDNFEIFSGTVEEHLPGLLNREQQFRQIAMIDPPRKGLSEGVVNLLAASKLFDKIMYLSCNPESLMRNLKILKEAGWEAKKVIPFDFFPKTKHLEVLTVLEKG